MANKKIFQTSTILSLAMVLFVIWQYIDFKRLEGKDVIILVLFTLQIILLGVNYFIGKNKGD